MHTNMPTCNKEIMTFTCFPNRIADDFRFNFRSYGRSASAYIVSYAIVQKMQAKYIIHAWTGIVFNFAEYAIIIPKLKARANASCGIAKNLLHSGYVKASDRATNDSIIVLVFKSKTNANAAINRQDPIILASLTEMSPLVIGLELVRLTLISKSLSRISLNTHPAVRVKSEPAIKINNNFVSGRYDVLAANIAHRVGHRINSIGIGL